METDSKSGQDDKLHFLDYWRIIRVRKAVILLVFLLVALSTTGVTFILPKTFMSTARIAVEKDTSDIAPLLGIQMAATPFDPYFIHSEFEKIQSQKVLDKVIENVGLREKWRKTYGGDNQLSLRQTREILTKSIDVRQYRNTSIIEIRAYSQQVSGISGAELASDIAQSVAETYSTSRTENQKTRAEDAIKVLEKEYENHKDEIKEVQDEVDNLRQILKISDAASEGNYYSILEPETVRRFEAERITAEGLHTRQAKLLDGLKDKTLEELRSAISTAYPDPQLDTLLRDLNTAQAQFAKVNVDLGPQHPAVVSLLKVIATLEIQVDERITGILAGLEIAVESSRAQVEQLKQSVEEAKKREAEAQQEYQQYFAAKRQLSTKQRILETIHVRILQEKVDMLLPKTSMVEIIDKAEPDPKAVRPNKPLNIALGCIVGLVIGVGLAFFIEYLDTSVKTIDDVERSLGSPVLGVIPQNVGSLMDEGEDSPHAEAYRVLRTNVLFAAREHDDQRAFSVVSGGAGEGKTTTMFNLAVVFAQQGDKVLVVDSDLRRPSMHRYMKVSNSKGLTNYLLGQNTMEEVIQSTSTPTLHFLPSGKLPSSSLGILSSSKMKEFVEETKKHYDYIFYDAPPIMGVSDASVLASVTDLCFLVVQYRKYPQIMTQRAKQMVTKVGGTLVGVVLNNINISQDSYYYYYSGYYYDYYYSRKTGEDEDSGAKKDTPVKQLAQAKQGGAEIKPKY